MTWLKKCHRNSTLFLTLLLAALALWLFLATSTGPVQGAPTQRPNPRPMADVEVAHSGPDAAFADDIITYTILLTNTGNTTLSDIVITDTWATKMSQDIGKMWQYNVLAQYIQHTAYPPNAIADYTYQINEDQKRGELTWMLNPVAPNQAVKILLTARVPITLQPTLRYYEAIPGTSKRQLIGPSDVENTVTVVAQGSQYLPPVAGTHIIAPLLELDMRAEGETTDTNQCRVGRLITYTLSVYNFLPDERSDTYPASNLVVYNELPTEIANTLLISDVNVPGVYITKTNEAMAWRFPSDFVLDPGQTTVLTMVARVPTYTVYGPSTKYLRAEWETVRAHADAMPFRDATIRSDHKARIFSPFEKSVVTGPPLKKGTTTYPNNGITYTLTFYNPLHDQDVNDMILADTLPVEAGLTDTFRFVGMVSALGDPQVIDSQLVWEDVSVPANGVISVTFEVLVHPQILTGKKCSTPKYTNAVSATLHDFIYDGHNNNRYASVAVTRQLNPIKRALPTIQYAGGDITYTIIIENLGDTPINPPVVVTDEIPTILEFTAMVDTFPGAPALITETPELRFYRWDNVLQAPLAPGESFEFSYKVIANEVSKKVINSIHGYNEDTSFCLTTRSVKVEPAIWYTKIVSPEMVTQGELITYSVEVFNLSPRNYFTMTQFRDYLESTPIKGTRDVIDGDEVYEYILPEPFILEPKGAAWSHTFLAHMVGYGIGHSWCENLARPSKGIIPQRGYDIQEYITPPGAWYMGENVKVAPVCVLPHVSLFQQVWPNPVGIGEEFTVTLTLRDNRAMPVSAIDGVTLTWNVPLTGSVSGEVLPSFVILDSDLAPTETGDGFYRWRNLTIPAGDSLVINVRARAPMFVKRGWSKSYGADFIAEVAPLADAGICVPPTTKFIRTETLPDSCSGNLGNLTINQGVELDKIPTQKEVPPYGLLTYRLIVKNLTGAPAYNVRVTDTLPSLGDLHWQYVKMEDGPEPISLDPLVWLIDEVPAKDRVELYFTVRAHQFLGLEYNQVTGIGSMHVGLNKRYTDHVEVEVISGIGMFKVADPDTIYAGDATTYTLILNNGSEDTLSNIIITDTLPHGFTYTHVIEPAIDPTVDGNTLVWHVPGELRKDQTFQLVYVVRTDEEIFSGYYYSELLAQATDPSTGDEVKLPASEEIAPVYVQGLAQVLADKSASPSKVYANESVTYTVTLFNETDTSHTVGLTDTLPVSFTFANTLGTTPAPTIIPGTKEKLVWYDLGILAPGETLTLTFVAMPDFMSISGLYCNGLQARMGALNLPPRTPSAGCVRLSQVPRINVQLSKDDGQTLIAAGDTLQYTLMYTNSDESESAIQGVVITDTFISYDLVESVVVDENWQRVGDQYIYRDNTPLEPGESAFTQFTVVLTDTIPEDVEWVQNRATIDYVIHDETVEFGVDDNRADDIDFFRAADLLINDVQIMPSVLTGGQPMTIVVMVQNQGDPIIRRWDGSQDNPYELFAVEVYVRKQPSTPPQNVFDHVGGWERGEAYLQWIDGRLDTGASTPVTFSLEAPSGGLYDVYAQVDVSQATQTSFWGQPWGLILELNEDNNVSTAYTLPMMLKSYLPLVLRQ